MMLACLNNSSNLSKSSSSAENVFDSQIISEQFEISKYSESLQELQALLLLIIPQ